MLPVELKSMIFGYATATGPTGCDFDGRALRKPSRYDTRTKLALCLTSKAIKRVADALMYECVTLRGGRIPKVAKLIRNGEFKASLVKELRLVNKGFGTSVMGRALPSATKIIAACPNLAVLNLTDFLPHDVGEECRTHASRLRKLWGAIPPSITTMCISNISHLPFLYDKNLSMLKAFVGRHPELRIWKVASITTLASWEPFALFQTAKILSIGSGYFPRGIPDPSCFKEVESLFLNCYTLENLKGAAFPKLEDVCFSHFSDNLKYVVGTFPSMKSLRYKMDWRFEDEWSYWDCHFQASKLEHIVIDFFGRPLLAYIFFCGPLEPQILRKGDMFVGEAYARWHSVAEEEIGIAAKKAKATLSIFTNRTHFPELKTITIDDGSIDMEEENEVGKSSVISTFKVLFGFLASNGVHVEYVIGKHRRRPVSHSLMFSQGTGKSLAIVLTSPRYP